jgi:hypothetical protein
MNKVNLGIGNELLLGIGIIAVIAYLTWLVDKPTKKEKEEELKQNESN